MSTYIVTYKKEYAGAVEEFSVKKEAKKPSDAKREIQRACILEAEKVRQKMQEEKAESIACGGYGKDIGLYKMIESKNPLYGPRKGKWILRYFDFKVTESEQNVIS